MKLSCPTLGKMKIVEKLARVGVHIGKTTVGRILQEKPADASRSRRSNVQTSDRHIVAKYRQDRAINDWCSEHRPHMTRGNRRRTRFTCRVLPRTSSRVMNHISVGRVVRLVPNRKSKLMVLQVKIAGQ